MMLVPVQIMEAPLNILVTGATGYIGGRLAPRLVEKGYSIRCLARDESRLQGRPWINDVEIVKGDVLDPGSIVPALQGVDIAYYLIHSLESKDFSEKDRIAADNFGKAAQEAGVKRIIYLGGLQPRVDRVSNHLKSRLQTGDHLRAWGVPVTEFRAGAIIGSGSLSFEVVRYLTERLPFMVTPRWVWTLTQPIAVRNVLEYLIKALEMPSTSGETYDIGGPHKLTYGQMMIKYAEIRGLRRYSIPVPLLTPYWSSHWVGLITPLNGRIVKPLVEGLDNELVVQDNKAASVFNLDLIPYKAAVRLALERFAADSVETTWKDSIKSMGVKIVEEPLVDKEGMIQDRRHLKIKAPVEEVFNAIKSLGGDNGWYFADSLWKLRGFLDMLVGGIGMRKSRRSYSDVRPGDTIDFWRVEAVEHDKLLRLRAEMKLPGKAWLQYELESVERNTCILTQTAFYEPKGLFGFLYWYALYVPHLFVFPGMLKALGEQAVISWHGKM